MYETLISSILAAIVIALPIVKFRKHSANQLTKQEKVEGVGHELLRHTTELSEQEDAKRIKQEETARTVADISRQLASITANMSRTNDDIFPYRFNVEFCDDIEKRSDLLRGGVWFVFVSSSSSGEELAINLASSYVKRGLLPFVRNLLDSRTMSLIDIYTVNKELRSLSDQRPHQLFERTIYSTAKDTETAHYLASLKALDDIGLFDRILLRELAESGFKATESQETELRDDSRGIFRMLCDLAQKDHGVDVNPTYLGKVMRVKVVLFEANKVRENPGRYFQSVYRAHRDGVENVYLVAFGRINSIAARGVYQFVENDDRFDRVFIEGYRGQLTKFGADSTEMVCAMLKCRRSRHKRAILNQRDYSDSLTPTQILAKFQSPEGDTRSLLQRRQTLIGPHRSSAN